MRRHIKRLVEKGLAWLPSPSLLRRQGRGTLVLAYHNIVPDGASPVGDRSLHLSRVDFADQLDLLLAEGLEVAGLRDLEKPPAAPVTARVVITFDDAYLGAMTLGVAELAERGLPATVFVAPGLLGGQAFWWDILGEQSALTPGRRGRLLDQDEGRQERILARLPSPSPLPEWARSATVGHLRKAVQSGVTLGNHTWDHPNLGRLGVEEVAEELTRTRDWFQAQRMSCVPWVAYPYGISSAQVEQVVESLGFAGGFRIEGGWARGHGEPRFQLPRMNVPAGLSRDGFLLRLRGWLSGK